MGAIAVRLRLGGAKVPELATAATLVLVAAVAMIDTFRTSGWVEAGPASGWYPFWSAAALGGSALVALGTSLTRPAGAGVFSAAEGAGPLLRVAAPMIAVAIAIPWLGFYVTSGLYMGGFARWQGRYSWLVTALLALILPLALYLSFEQGFRVPLPKSILYQLGILPF